MLTADLVHPAVQLVEQAPTIPKVQANPHYLVDEYGQLAARKVTSYRCKARGHSIRECKAKVLCDICIKDGHLASSV